MGQGLSFCNCYHYNCCANCSGLSVGALCCGCWGCIPEPLEHMRTPGCMKCQCNQGCGISFFFFSSYCCTPTFLQDYSIWLTIGKRYGSLYDVDIRKKAVVKRDEPIPATNRNLY